MHAGPSETTIQYIIRDQIYNASVPALSTLCLSTPPYSLLVLLEDSHQAKQHQATAMLYVHIIHLLLTYTLYIYIWLYMYVCLPNKVWFDLIWFDLLNVAHVTNDVKWRPIVTKFGTLIENMSRKGLYDCRIF